jgi:hypothetical protein
MGNLLVEIYDEDPGLDTSSLPLLNKGFHPLE